MIARYPLGDLGPPEKAASHLRGEEMVGIAELDTLTLSLGSTLAKVLRNSGETVTRN